MERIDIIKNKERVRVYIKTDSLGKDFYVKKFKKDLSKEKQKIKGSPLFDFEVTDLKSFKDALKTYYEKNPAVAQVAENPVSEPEWFGPIFNTIFSLVLI
ncbi:MAG: AAA family ATPase, partial [Sphingobacteriia bacterium]